MPASKRTSFRINTTGDSVGQGRAYENRFDNFTQATHSLHTLSDRPLELLEVQLS
jgi:hypothetical protein